MGAPDTWSAPSSVASVGTATTFNAVSHAGSYWFSVTREASSAIIRLRYATNPTGTWTEVSLPAAPIGYTTSYGFDYSNAVVYGDGDYGLLTRYSNGATLKYRILHATDPTGTWSSHEYDATDNYVGEALTYGDGTWVVGGNDKAPASKPAMIAYCSTIDGTYTVNTSAAATGYDTSGGVSWSIVGILWDGTQWVSVASRSGSPKVEGRYSTSLTSGWAAPTSMVFTGNTEQFALHSNGWWTVADGNTNILYTDDPTGTWSTFGTADHGMTTSVGNIAYNAGYWVVTGAVQPSTYREPRIAYLASTGSPSGTYTEATSEGFTTPAQNAIVVDVRSFGSYFVASSDYQGELRYCRVGAPTYLRQRQSPVRSPSRVSWKAY